MSRNLAGGCDIISFYLCAISYTKREGLIREAKARERVHLIESAVVTSLDRRSFLFFGTSYRKNSHR